MKIDPQPIRLVPQAPSAQVVETPKRRVYAKRVPSALTDHQRAEALAWLRGGRSVHTVAYEFSVSESVILEIWLRSVERQIRRSAA